MGRPAVRPDRRTTLRLEPATTAVRAALRARLDDMLAEESGVREGLDAEHLHRFRVAGRSARSVLRRAGDTLPRGGAGKLSAGLAWLATLTGPPRDLDVHIAQLPGGEDVGPLREALLQEQRSARAELLDGLDSPRYEALVRRWSDIAGQDAVRHRERRRPAGPVVDARVAAAHRRVLELGRSLGPDPDPADLHRLRKRAKALRYLLENFSAFYPPASWKAAVRELKSLQDNLGEHQDCQVQADRLAVIAGRPGDPAGPAARRILALLEGRRERSRAELSSRFQHFSTPEVTELFGRLYGPGAGRDPALPHTPHAGRVTS